MRALGFISAVRNSPIGKSVYCKYFSYFVIQVAPATMAVRSQVLTLDYFSGQCNTAFGRKFDQLAATTAFNMKVCLTYWNHNLVIIIIVIIIFLFEKHLNSNVVFPTIFACVCVFQSSHKNCNF